MRSQSVRIQKGIRTVSVTVCFADVTIELPYAGAPDNVEIEATILFGRIAFLAPHVREQDAIVHRAFVITGRKLITKPPPLKLAGKSPPLSVSLIGVGGDMVVQFAPHEPTIPDAANR
jgi:hypothetical protein